jgi:hypothetical protein
VSIINKKIYIALAILAIIVVVAGVASYQLLYSNPSSEGGSRTQTAYTLGNATNVQFTVQSTSGDVMTEITFAGKNLNSTDPTLRVDLTSGDSVLSYLIFGNQTAWNNETGTWKPSDYATDWNNWNTNQFAVYRSHNASWKSGDADIYYFNDSGTEIKIFDISINPTLNDSLFIAQ